MMYFNSQPHEEADRINNTFLGKLDISTHSLTKRLTVKTLRRSWRRFNFNSQPHEEADIPVLHTTSEASDISTHSLTKRLTTNRNTCADCKNISTHSLTKRLTIYRNPLERRKRYFNSQPHEEADVDGVTTYPYYVSFQLTASRRG